jgi:hypothetical protein
MTAEQRQKRNSYQSAWYRAHRDALILQMRERYQRTRIQQEDRRRKKIYGVSREQFDELYRKQNGVCAICRKPETRIRAGRLTNLAVDHCKNAGHVRGLLCASCNSAIGLMGHSVAIAGRALKYLKDETLFNQ